MPTFVKWWYAVLRKASVGNALSALRATELV
jgi:hypothetical protein